MVWISSFEKICSSEYVHPSSRFIQSWSLINCYVCDIYFENNHEWIWVSEERMECKCLKIESTVTKSFVIICHNPISPELLQDEYFKYIEI